MSILPSQTPLNSKGKEMAMVQTTTSQDVIMRIQGKIIARSAKEASRTNPLEGLCPPCKEAHKIRQDNLQFTKPSDLCEPCRKKNEPKVVVKPKVKCAEEGCITLISESNREDYCRCHLW